MQNFVLNWLSQKANKEACGRSNLENRLDFVNKMRFEKGEKELS